MSEQLEKIEEWYKKFSGVLEDTMPTLQGYAAHNNILWLIQQAKKTEQLQKEVNLLCDEKAKQALNKQETPMVEEKSWLAFYESGLLWWINGLLHTFGWAIIVKVEENRIVRAFPSRVKFRGFDEKTNSQGYIKLSNYLKEHAAKLAEEAKE
jgi:hypothetical protein